MVAYYMTWLRSKLGAEAGQGLVEYALIIVLIAVALIAALGVLRDSISSVFSSIKSGMGV